MKAPIDLDQLSAITVAGAPPLTNEQVEDLRRHLGPMVIAAPDSPRIEAPRQSERRAA